jgi:ATP-dependent DNA helicase 2 subunit 2
MIVAIETQHIYLSSKRTWTRKIVILTDGECPIELDEWENTAQAVNDRNIILTIVYVSIVSPHPPLMPTSPQRG